MKKQNEMIYERELDLWIYEMPFKSMTDEDIKESRNYGVQIYRSVIHNCDYIVGTWHSLEYFMAGWLNYEMNAEYMNPLYVGKRVLD